MIFFYSICGVGVVAAGLAIGELFGRKRRQLGIDSKRIDAGKANTMVAPYFGGEILPKPGEDRPLH